jgi:FtsH-binding integral membrane protein
MYNNTNRGNKDMNLIPVYASEISEEEFFNEFTNLNQRKNFISKVYSLLWFQLLITSVFIGVCNQINSVKTFLVSKSGVSLLYVSSISIIIMSLSMFCIGNSLRKSPFNYIYLFFFNIFMNYSLGYVGIFYNTNIILLAGVITFSLFSVLTLYAVQTKYDYTTSGNIVLISLFGLILFGILTSFFNNEVVNIMYASFGAILFSFYIVYDTQLIVGGSHRKIQFSEDDYVLASIILYLDVINLFLFILDLLPGRNKD